MSTSTNPAASSPESTVPGAVRWSGVDVDTASLLTHLAGPADPDATDAEQADADREWAHFVATVRASAREHRGVLHPNHVRRELAGVINAKRIGAFYRRAVLSGLLTPATSHEISTDLKSRNRGKPIRVYRLKEPKTT